MALKNSIEPKSYSISDLSQQFEVTTRSIRFYEDKGLLAPKRQASRRIYSGRDRVRLELILRGKRLGFSLSEIRELFDLYDSTPGEEGQLKLLISKIDDHRKLLLQQRHDLELVLKEMDEVEDRARRALAAARSPAA